MDLVVEASSSWECENNSNLSAAIKIVDIFPEEDIFEILTEDQCISLKQPADCSVASSECSVYIKLIGTDNTKLLQSIVQSVQNGDSHHRNKNLQDNNNESSLLNGKYNSEGKNSPCIVLSSSLNQSQKQNLDSSNCLDEMIILSEARFVELYRTPHMEYVTTIHSTLLSEFEDSKIYQTSIMFSKLEKSIILKLKGLFCQDSVWIYGIFVKLKQKCDKHYLEKSSTEDPIGLILKEKNIVLSEKAEKFKKLLDVCKSFQSNYEPLVNPFHATFSTSNTHRARSNEQNENQNWFLNLEATLANSSQKESLVKKSNIDSVKDPASEMEKLLGKMRELLSEQNDTQAMNNLHLMRFLSTNNNSASYKPLDTPDSTSDNSADFISAVNLNSECNEIRSPTPFSTPQSNNEKICEMVNSIIDKKMEQLEKKVVHKMEAKIVEANNVIIKRLDRIENLLIQLTNTESARTTWPIQVW